MTVDRSEAVALLERYIVGGRLTIGQIGFDHIAKDYGMSGTTCGYLPHWMYWRLGCKDEILVNRFEPDSSVRYLDWENISAVSGHSSFHNNGGYAGLAQDLFKGRQSLDGGDTVIIKGKNMISKSTGYEFGTEHIFVVLNTVTRSADAMRLRIAQAGQGSSPETQAANIAEVTVALKPGTFDIGGTNVSGPLAIIHGEWAGDRAIIGWLPFAALSFDSPPIDDHDDLLIEFANRPSDKTVTKEFNGQRADKGTIWRVTFEIGEDWYYLFYNGYRVFAVDPTRPSVIQSDGGLWVTDSGEVLIQWPGRFPFSGQTERWRALQGRASGRVDGGASLTAQRLTDVAANTILASYAEKKGLAVRRKEAAKNRFKATRH